MKDLSSHLQFLDEKTCVVYGDDGHSESSSNLQLEPSLAGTIWDLEYLVVWWHHRIVHKAVVLTEILRTDGRVRGGRQAHPLPRGRVNHPPKIEQEQTIAVIYDLQIHGVTGVQEVEPAANLGAWKETWGRIEDLPEEEEAIEPEREEIGA